MSLRADRRTAAIVALSLHIAALAVAYMTHLQQPEAVHTTLEINLMVSPEREPHRTQAQADRVPSTLRNIRPLPAAAPVPAADPKREVVVIEPILPDNSDTVKPRPQWKLPKNVLENDWTPEQAWGELTQLLHEHPEYKDMVLREMLAGSGFVKDSLPPLSFHLDDVMKFEEFLPSWMYEAQRMQGLHGGYSPVMGTRRIEQYTGPQIDIIGAYKFLRGLIEGDDKPKRRK